MKNIICSLLLMLCIKTYSQNSTPTPSPSGICPQLQAFNGEWLYANGNDTIRIYMRYHECLYTGGTPETLGTLWIWHEYKQGSTIIESTYPNRFMTLPTIYDSADLTKISGSLLLPACNFTKKRLLGRITDISQARESKIVRAYFDSEITKIIWKQRHSEGYGFKTGAYGMTLPKEFILFKQ